MKSYIPDQTDFALIINSIKDYAIFMLDPSGVIMSWNPGAEKIKGYKASEIIGKHFSTFYTDEDKAIAHPTYELNLAAMTGRYEEEGWRVKKDGSRFWANVIITRLTDDQGKIIGFAKITRDLTERRNTEEALRESEERFRLMVESVRDYAILMLDPEGKIVSWNEGAQRIKGWLPNEIIGRHFSSFYTTEDIQSGKPEYELKIAASEGRFEDIGWRIRKDGSRFWANVIITALKDETGKIRGFSKVTRDITDKLKAEQALQEAYANLERRVVERTEALTAANQELESFSYSVSHDLRAPLRSMDGFSQALLVQYGDKLDQKGKEYLTRIRDSAQRMGNLIEDILNLSKLGRTEVKKCRVNLTNLFETIGEKLLQLHPSRKIEIRVMPGMEAYVDEGMMKILIDNLLGNSIKYTSRKESALIEVGFHKNGSKKVFFVKDNGAGFDMAYVDKLFLPFNRLHSEKEFPGTGIGLASVKRVLSKHGGSVWAEGRVGEGSTFYFTLSESGA